MRLVDCGFTQNTIGEPVADHGAYAVNVTCCRCGSRVRLASATADLDGPAFVAYFCHPRPGYSNRDCRPTSDADARTLYATLGR